MFNILPQGHVLYRSAIYARKDCALYRSEIISLSV